MIAVAVWVVAVVALMAVGQVDYAGLLMVFGPLVYLMNYAFDGTRR